MRHERARAKEMGEPSKSKAAVRYTKVATFLLVMLVVGGCAGESYSSWIESRGRVTDILSVPVGDLLARVRVLALSDDPADAEVYEPLLGLVSEPVIVVPRGTLTLVRWASQGIDQQRIVSTVDRIVPRPPEAQTSSVRIRLVPPSTYPCITLQDVFSVFGTEYRVPLTSAPTGRPGFAGSADGLPFLIGYHLRSETATTLYIDRAGGCVVSFSIESQIHR